MGAICTLQKCGSSAKLFLPRTILDLILPATYSSKNFKHQTDYITCLPNVRIEACSFTRQIHITPILEEEVKKENETIENHKH